MPLFDRRKFMKVAAMAPIAQAASRMGTSEMLARAKSGVPGNGPPGAVQEDAVDFRYHPGTWQSTICFPDDPFKSLVGQRGELRYWIPQGQFHGPDEFATIVEFRLQGMQADGVIRQRLHDPSTPILHTTIQRAAATLELTAFATNRAGEGRVDNVLLTIEPLHGNVEAAPLVRLRSGETFALAEKHYPLAVVTQAPANNVYMIGAALDGVRTDVKWQLELGGGTLAFSPEITSARKPLRYFLRFPQEDQGLEQISQHLQDADQLLADAIEYWRNWHAFKGEVHWSFPQQQGAFLLACARNIQQAREIRDGKPAFQVGPTIYRGLWIVDGNFLLEAARYLGYDKEATDGLRYLWSKQQADGQIVAAGGREHWKDTAIAMFSLVRQCELDQNWDMFRELEVDVLHGVEFLIRLRDQARVGKSTNGRYGLLAPGFADGGIADVRSEFTNTLWALAGLRAVSETGQRLKMKSMDRVTQFYQELQWKFRAAARQEMVRHPGGFDYLPMLAKDDVSWNDPDLNARPQPQSAQWALSHAIYPGLIFDRSDPIVSGHIALMKWCTREAIPAETGWIHHGGVWNYGASFAAHVYLWAGMQDWALSTFRGFLNHASPTYCWREEQPLQDSLIGHIYGDMPHNWASAECIRFLRHMLVLEDGQSLRLLQGISNAELSPGKPWTLAHSPTNFGRISVNLEPLASKGGWTLRYIRGTGPDPLSVELPRHLGQFKMSQIEGAKFHDGGTRVRVEPSARIWTAYWR